MRGADGYATSMELLGQPEKLKPASLVWPSIARGRIARRAALAVPAILLLWCAWQRRWISDDGFIDLRIVEHLLVGHGPVFNTGERVEAYTNPLWVALLTLWGLAGGRLEIGAIALGLLLGGAGVALAQAAAARLWRRSLPSSRHPLLPLGALVFVVLPPTWDFTTSGLELSLVFAWLGLCGWLLARLICQRKGTMPSAIIVGLGPLIRPDLAVFSATFCCALLFCAWHAPYGRRFLRVFVLAAAVWAVPCGYQIFRMGYFAAFLPNTLIAKEAGGSRWVQGSLYAFDFLQPYLLPLPLLLLIPVGGMLLRQLLDRRDNEGIAVVVAFLSGAVLHGMAVLRVGGDFMHGRLLLPALFALLLPVAAVAIPAPLFVARRPSKIALLATAIVIWAVCCAFFARVPYAGGVSSFGIADERSFYVRATGYRQPVLAEDYRTATIAQHGAALRAWTGDRAVLVQNTEQCLAFGDEPQSPGCQTVLASLPGPLPTAAWVSPEIQVVSLQHQIGVISYVAGPRAFIVDRLGLAEPIASRLQLTMRGRPGHEKWLSNAWYLARFSAPTANDDASIIAARTALGCGDLALLNAAVTKPLTQARFLSNLRLAWRLTRVQIPADPVLAQAQFCGIPATGEVPIP